MARARHSPSELVLVASERHAEHEASQGARALTLRDFTSRINDEAFPELREASLETTRLLAQRTLQEKPRALAWAVDDALGQLKRSGARARDLLRVSGPRAPLLADALERTDARLAELGLRDLRADAFRAAGALERTTLRELEGVRQVRVRGISYWENADLNLLEALHRKLRGSAGGVLIELPSAPETLGSSLVTAVAQIAARFEQRWADDGDHPELEFSEARGEAKPPSVIEAAHEASEARAVARAVLDALAGGAALDRIAIVPVDAADAFLEPLRAELSAARLPFSEAWSRSASAAPEAHAALELLRLAQGPIQRDALVDVLRVPDLELAALGVDSSSSFIEVIARLPVRVDRSGRELLAALRAERLRRDASHEREQLAFVHAETALTALFSRLAALKQPNTRRAFRERSRALFAELGLLSASRRGLRQALHYAEQRDRAPLSALGQNARAGRAIDLALERVVAAAEQLQIGHELLELREFYEEFALALAHVGANQGAARAGTLRVARASEVCGLNWDLLIVCRAASSTLDWQGSSSDGVLDSALIEQLPPKMRPLTATDRALYTRFALASSLSRADRSVVTWAKRDARGGSGASRLVMSLRALTTRVEPASSFDPAARRVLAMPVPSAEVRYRAAHEVRRQDFYANPESLPDAHNGRAGPLAGWVGGDADRPIALTQLERYARCGFLAFSGLVLRAVQDEVVGDGLGARERGTLIHDALAVALSGSREHFGTRELAVLEREALERAELFLRARISSNLRGAAFSALLDDVAALLRWSFANSDGIWFSEAERAFGHGEEWSALAVGEHFVSGRIDRIDSNSDRRAVRVIDYKTGSVKLSGEHGEQLLQPWLYARKVAEEYGAERVSSGYLSLQRRKPEWKAAIEDSSPEAAAIVEKLTRAEALITSFRAGQVSARPALATSCERCDARDICRRPLSAPHEAGE